MPLGRRLLPFTRMGEHAKNHRRNSKVKQSEAVQDGSAILVCLTEQT